jgi:protein-tyrosine phosphatase
MVTGEAVDRTVSVEGLCNARDLGGLGLASGGHTPYRVFFRSECLHRVTPNGWKRLRELGVRTVVDLRQPSERDKQSYDCPAWVTVVSVDHDGLDEHPDFWADYWDNGLVATALYYLPHLQQLPERSADVLIAIANAPDGGVLFHCAGGRDRTGIVALLLLAIAGAESDAIVEDYLDSVRNGDTLGAALGRANDEPEREALCREHGTTTEGAFRQVVQQLDLAAIRSLVGDDAWRTLSTWRGGLSPK